jgi:DNA modification methylase
MTGRIIIGDCRDGLAMLPDQSVHCVVTSPPYLGLRNYGVDGQIGLESSIQEYIDVMIGVFGEVRRVLRDDGTLWLNMGDMFASSGGHSAQGKSSARVGRSNVDVQNAVKGFRPGLQFNGIKNKDLIGMPWRVAFALQADGWYLRSDIIWAKPAPMPESVTDRPTRAHEYIFLLTKSPRYFYDVAAIREPFADGRRGADYPRPNAPDKIKSPYGQGFTRAAQQQKKVGGWAEGPGAHSAIEHNAGDARRPISERNRGGRTDGLTKSNNIDPSKNGGRNKRSVWTIASEPFPEAHFATFPKALVEPCLKAGCPSGGTVLDPFFGAGTTGLVAESLQRNWIGVELNPKYVDMARRRIGLAEITIETTGAREAAE